MYPNGPEAADERLVEQARRNDEDAFAQLLSRYLPLIQKKAFRFAGLGVDRDDLYQEGTIGFLNAVRNFQQNGGASFKTYASLCVERKMLSVIKGIGRKKQMPAQSMFSIDQSADGRYVESLLPPHMIIDPEERLIDREDYQSVLGMMDKVLSDLEHRVFQLYLGGRSYLEISATLGLSEKSVDNALQRIRRKLRKAVSGESENANCGVCR